MHVYTVYIMYVYIFKTSFCTCLNYKSLYIYHICFLSVFMRFIDLHKYIFFYSVIPLNEYTTVYLVLIAF